MTYTTAFDPLPARLVSRGTFNYGVFNQPLTVINMREADLGPLRLLGLKQWQHFAFGNERFFLNMVIFDSKRVNMAQVEVYDRETDKHYAFEKRFVHRRFTIPDELWDAEARIDLGDMWIHIRNHLAEGYHHISFGARDRKQSVAGDIRVDCPVPQSQPLVVCLPFARDRAMYSHKGVFKATGSIRIDGSQFDLGAKAFAIPDIHKGYYPATMMWNWGTGAGYAGDRLIGFNLTTNQALQADKYHENAVWVDGRVARLPPVTFDLQLDKDGSASVRDAAGLLDLRFKTIVPRKVDLNLGLIKSRYRGPYGIWQGQLPIDGVSEKVTLFGMAEDMFIRA